MALDITISPLYRVGGQDQPSLPGLMAALPPRKVARGRQQDRLIVYLVLGGEAAVTTGDYVQAVSRAAVSFFETPGTLTAALRTAASSINQLLYSRNQSRSAPGQYTLGLLTLAAVRDSQVTMLMSGPMQAFVISSRGVQHLTESLSGRGLGLSETAPHHFSQVSLEVNDRLLLCAKPPTAWAAPLQDFSPASLDATRRRLMAAAPAEVNAILLQATEGEGTLNVTRPAANGADTLQHGAATSGQAAQLAAAGPGVQEAEVPAANALSGRDADLEAPSAYAIPPDAEAELPAAESTWDEPPLPPGSLPRMEELGVESAARREPRRPSRRSREAARTVVSAMRTSRAVTGKVTQSIGNFIPRLLPVSTQTTWSSLSPAMAFIAVLVPLVVVTVATAVYIRFGRSIQYEQYLVQAQDARAQATGLTDAVAQREAWERELGALDQAENFNSTTETEALRAEAQQSLDKLLGIVRLQFQPVLRNGPGIRIGRLAAGANDLYVLDAERGAVVHLSMTGTGYELDRDFNCAPGTYDIYTVGPLVDLITLPDVNAFNAAILGVDAGGNLLYCAPGQVARGSQLPPPDTNWDRIKAFTLDGGNLYVLDSQAHAVWVYTGKNSAFVDRPYFFFGAQIPELEDAIDLAVSADNLYVLHSDGRVSTCSYSRVEAVPTRCTDPATLVNPLPAFRDVDLFSEAHFTEMAFSPAPDSALALLDADGQGVYRFVPRSLELQSQLRAVTAGANTLPAGQVTAMAFSPNHNLYFVIADRIYYAPNAP
jgi:hypothetical protein